MKKVTIGSTAIKHWFPDFSREPKDMDFAVDKENVASENIEDLRIEYLYNPIACKLGKDILEPSELLALKISHLFWDINWQKHINDVHFLLSKGVTYDYSLYKEFRNFFEDYLPKVRRSKLEQSKEEFFTNAVNKDTNEHDELHLKLAKVPAYTKILKDNCEVEVCETKFSNLTFEEKCDVAHEEAIVMAAERFSGKLNYRVAFVNQFKQNIQKHYPEFLALFCIENYVELTNLKKYKIKEKTELLNYINK